VTLASTFASSLGLSLEQQRIGFAVGVLIMVVGATLFVRGRTVRAKRHSDQEGAGTDLEDRAYKGRLEAHHRIGLERLTEIENARHQRHLPGLGGAEFEARATEDAKRHEQWWTEEARDLLSASPQLSEYFDHPSRMRQGPGVALGTELDRVAGLMRWRVGRLGEMLEWI
jgi:hypothetical protein